MGTPSRARRPSSRHAMRWRTVGRPSLPVLALSLGVPGVFLWIDVGVAS